MKQRTSRAAVLAAALVLTNLLLATPVHAAEDTREVQGRALYAKGDYQGALEIYATLFAERADPIYLRNIGRCNQKLRRPEQAINAFTDYLRRGRKISASEREEIGSYIKEMEELQARNEKRERERAERERERAERQAADAARSEPPPPRPQPIDTAAVTTAPAERAPAASPSSSTDVEVVPGTARQAAEAAGQTGTFFLALAAGSGFGLASGQGELNSAHRISASGFAATQLGHIAPELGIFVAHRLLLSAQLRLQYVSYVNGQYLENMCGTGERYCQPSALGLAAFGRVAWLSGSGRVHFIPGLAVGGGNIRHAVHFRDDDNCGRERMETCVDTIGSGPFLFGPSVGLLVELGDMMGLMATVNTQIGVPKFTLNFDLNAGLTFRL